MRVVRVTPNVTVPDLDEARAFYTDFLGLDGQDMGPDWVTRVVVPSSGEHIQLLSRDATSPENTLLSVKVDVDEAYATARRLGYEIVHPLTPSHGASADSSVESITPPWSRSSHCTSVSIGR